ncbi:hypothetical protein PI124_g3538 [Phytophthora idaei]|nr:hypothetical protein PI125_g2904 [Phytophthora idaei]KAG3251906.1 hypothetical protein PI124_g3538 [Phytophthora idaei]
MYEDFYETVRKIDGPARKLHSLSGLQKDYFTELGVRSGTVVEENIHDIMDPASGKWIRRHKPSTEAADLVKMFN